MVQFYFNRVEDIMGKGDNISFPHEIFKSFPVHGCEKPGIVW